MEKDKVLSLFKEVRKGYNESETPIKQLIIDESIAMLNESLAEGYEIGIVEEKKR